MSEHWIFPGEGLASIYWAAGAGPDFLQNYILYLAPGSRRPNLLEVPTIRSFTTDGTPVVTRSTDKAIEPGRIVGGGFAGQSSLAPGLFYNSLVIDRRGPDEWLCRGYLTDLVDMIPVDVHEGIQPRSYRRDKKYTAGTAINGTVSWQPAANSPMEIESVMLIIGGAKATPAMALIAKRQAAASLNLSRWAEDTAIAANELLTIPALGELQDTIASTSILTDSMTDRWIHNGDVLHIEVATMANTEIFTVRLRVKIHGPVDPTITTAANLTEADE